MSNIAQKLPNLYTMEAIKFMYFANNFNDDQLEEVFKATSAPEHLKSKFNNYCREIPTRYRNGTDVFLNWFMQLSRDNQQAVVEYINTNYTGV